MSDIVPQDTPLKQCTKCKRWKPVTSGYFATDRTKPDRLTASCKECRNAHARSTYIPKVRTSPPDGYKQCSECRQLKPATLEHFHSNPTIKDGLRSECKACRKVQEARNAYLNKDATQQIKRCPICQQDKPVEAFGRAKNRYDGRHSRCKECVNRLYAERHLKQSIESTIPQDCKQCSRCLKIKPATSDYFHKQPTGLYGLKGRCRECIAEVRKQTRATDREYDQWRYQQYPESRLVHARNRKARKKSIPGTHTPQQIREQYDRQRGKCYYCHHKIKWGKHHVDHTFPLSREGARNDIDSLVITCPTCNLKKGNKLPHEFFEGGRLL